MALVASLVRRSAPGLDAAGIETPYYPCQTELSFIRADPLNGDSMKTILVFRAESLVSAQAVIARIEM